MSACRTGEACGFTLTRSGASSTPSHSAVISDTIDALEAWWPPTFTPLRFGRTRLAWWTIDAASQSTRRWISSSVSRSVIAPGTLAPGAGQRVQSGYAASSTSTVSSPPP